MKNNNQTSFIIASSILVLVVFCAVSAYNIIPSNTKSDSYVLYQTFLIIHVIRQIYLSDSRHIKTKDKWKSLFFLSDNNLV